MNLNNGPTVEQPPDLLRQDDGLAEHPEPQGNGTNWGRLALIALAVALALWLTGAAVWFFSGEPILDAAELWKEFDKDYEAANQKYNNRFVSITGRVRIHRHAGQLPRTFFVPQRGQNGASSSSPEVRTSSA
jgi:hypothetical protein